jgi:type II secretory pathway component GspD/PulD (secretin)
MSPIRMLCVVSMLVMTGALQAQSSSATSAAAQSATPEHVENGVPISRLLLMLEKKNHKKLVVDPRVRGEVAVLNQDVSNLSYDDVLMVLEVNGFIAVENDNYLEVLPSANARQSGGPVISGKEKRPDAEIVTTVLSAKNLSVVQLVPILRPMIPQYGHLAALPCVNKLIMVDTYANVRRIESVIEALDVGSEPYKPEKCESRLPEHP